MRLKSRINTQDVEFRRNYAHHTALRNELQQLQAQLALGGDEKSRQRHSSRGKLLPRERVEALLDIGSPFLEFSQLAAWKVYEEDVPGAGLITGIGMVSGQACVIVANDATVKGGTYFPL